jgi:uncharacterized protein (TIGR03083 family)
MDGDFDDRCAVLGAAWGWWATTLAALDDEGWATPTRLEGSDVAALTAHHAMLVQGLGFLATQPVDAAPATATAGAMLRRFNEPTGVANTAGDAVAELARQQAAGMSPADLLGAFATVAPGVVTTLVETGPIVVDYFGNGPFPIGEAVAIAIMEAVVHGLDLRAAIGSAPPPPAAAVARTVDLLASVADPLEFIDAATGRRAEPVLPVLR